MERLISPSGTVVALLSVLLSAMTQSSKRSLLREIESQPEDDCLSSPCANGATCSDGLMDFFCHCVPGFTGKTCGKSKKHQIWINHCLEGLLHISIINNYPLPPSPGDPTAKTRFYRLPLGIVDVDDCSPSPCLHGVCYDKVNAYFCDCHAGYKGDNCTIDINDCSANPCIHGTCRDRVNDFQCSCDPGYTGKTCAIGMTEKPTGLYSAVWPVGQLSLLSALVTPRGRIIYLIGWGVGECL